ncbi:TRAP transporter small permease [Ammoniphilus sp. YIM 78166]|uniref:TRAP transporter small permease n=1 Tax=Ammoniphilus sp. YIM 78166 TaxID=1644106 RepID=UPI00106FDF63|nr:TRAP transporter small permease [Ammoniphilus sp. YIM 78166]
MKALHFISHWTDQACRYVMVLFMGLAFICTIYQVFSRYVLQSSFVMSLMSGANLAGFNFPWMEELIRYLFVWVVFLGVATVYKLKGHAHVEIVINFLPKVWKRRFAILVEAINVVFFALLFIKGLEMLKITNGQLSPSLQLNMAYMYTAIVACSLICFVHAVSFLLQDLGVNRVKKEAGKHAAPVQPETIG